MPRSVLASRLALTAQYGERSEDIIAFAPTSIVAILAHLGFFALTKFSEAEPDISKASAGMLEHAPFARPLLRHADALANSFRAAIRRSTAPVSTSLKRALILWAWGINSLQMRSGRACFSSVYALCWTLYAEGAPPSTDGRNPKLMLNCEEPWNVDLLSALMVGNYRASSTAIKQLIVPDEELHDRIVGVAAGVLSRVARTARAGDGAGVRAVRAFGRGDDMAPISSELRGAQRACAEFGFRAAVTPGVGLMKFDEQSTLPISVVELWAAMQLLEPNWPTQSNFGMPIRIAVQLLPGMARQTIGRMLNANFLELFALYCLHPTISEQARRLFGASAPVLRLLTPQAATCCSLRPSDSPRRSPRTSTRIRCGRKCWRWRRRSSAGSADCATVIGKSASCSIPSSRSGRRRPPGLASIRKSRDAASRRAAGR